MKKVLFTLTLALIASQAFAIEIIVNRTVLSHSPGNNYDAVNRYTDPEVVTIEGVSKLQAMTVYITCSGNGTKTCPTAIALPADEPAVTEIPVNVLSFAQSAFDTYSESIDETGVVPDPVNETILGNDSNYYVCTISSTTDSTTGEIVTTLNIIPL